VKVRARFRPGDRERLAAKFRALPEAAKRAMAEDIESAAGTIERSAKRRAPKDEGGLREGIAVQILDGGMRVIISALRIATRGKLRANIAWFVEFGTQKMPARPFLFPAWRASRNRLRRRIRTRVREAFGLVARR
jgi:HK97 gp10 family phage protein